SAIYFDVLKDRLYTSAKRSHTRRSGQTALYKIHYALTRLVAPLLSFTAEEVWTHTAKLAGAPESVHMALLPEPEELAGGLSAERLAEWNYLMDVREAVMKKLEEARQQKLIGTSLEAAVRLKDPRLKADMDLQSIFIVSEVTLEAGEATEISIERAPGTKCERCWKYSTRIGVDPRYPTVCDSCAAALGEDFPV
ncbi:MAG TPA: class I tRNA ligase family protein, partial [Bryobacteraceae bacterium]|nr:class I tRNA ligase family protein [Bryobacteraceae bacterium]